MKKLFPIISLNFIFSFSISQNLMTNGDFENFSSCPTTSGQVSLAQGWVLAQCTPDYLNSCNTNTTTVNVPTNAWGNQTAHSGVAYCGEWVFAKGPPNGTREYIEATLTNTMIAGNKYAVSFYVSLSDLSEYSISSIGAYFSPTLISNGSSACSRLTYMPQILNPSTNQLSDKNNWMLIADTMIASGGELYMIIGNFNLDSTSDSLYLGSIGGFKQSYYYIDDVSVIDLGPSNINEYGHLSHIQLAPNPSNGEIMVTSKIKANKNLQAEVCDLGGRLILKQVISITNGQAQLSLDVAEGCYFLYLRENESMRSSIYKIMISK